MATSTDETGDDWPLIPASCGARIVVWPYPCLRGAPVVTNGRMSTIVSGSDGMIDEVSNGWNRALVAMKLGMRLFEARELGRKRTREDRKVVLVSPGANQGATSLPCFTGASKRDNTAGGVIEAMECSTFSRIVAGGGALWKRMLNRVGEGRRVAWAESMRMELGGLGDENKLIGDVKQLECGWWRLIARDMQLIPRSDFGRRRYNFAVAVKPALKAELANRSSG